MKTFLEVGWFLLPHWIQEPRWFDGMLTPLFEVSTPDFVLAALHRKEMEMTTRFELHYSL